MTPLATCLLCGKAFEGPAIAIVGHQDQQREAYLERLSRHLQKRHPEQAEKMLALGGAFMEMIYLRNFKTTDPELKRASDFVRWQIHQQTILKTYPDHSLRDDAAALGGRLCAVMRSYLEECGGITDVEAMQSEVTSVVLEAFTAIRDSLEERGKYELPVVGAPHGTAV